METLKSKIIDSNRPIYARIYRQFGEIPIDMAIDENSSDAQIFYIITRGRGAGKSHCSKHYPKHEGKMRGS
ncbi:MAG TPA: hypothetical protein VN174_01285 [Candidatus Methanoperedens sp.]|nr:hypothetical protein [Candidatus Methanoperedens sp.]